MRRHVAIRQVAVFGFQQYLAIGPDENRAERVIAAFLARSATAKASRKWSSSVAFIVATMLKHVGEI